MKRAAYFLTPVLLASLAIACDSGSSPTSPTAQGTDSKAGLVPATVTTKAGKKVKNNDPPKAMPRPKANPYL